jgi:hypothetical protein
MPSAISRQTLTGLSSTSGFLQWFPEDIKPFSVSVSAVVNSSAISFNVECSLDYTGSSTFISTAATWFSSGLAASTSNALVNFAFPVSALRVNAVSGSSTGTISATFNQAG